MPDGCTGSTVYTYIRNGVIYDPLLSENVENAKCRTNLIKAINKKFKLIDFFSTLKTVFFVNFSSCNQLTLWLSVCLFACHLDTVIEQNILY